MIPKVAYLFAFFTTVVVLSLLAMFLVQTTVGSAAAPAPVVMVHGCCGGSPAGLDTMASAFMAAGYTVYTPAMPSDTSPTDNAAYLKTFIDGLGVPQVHLVAHSMGGLESRAYIKNLGGASKVIDLVTIDTPHYGFWLGCFIGQGQMCPGSSFLNQLNVGDDTLVRTTQLMGQVDLRVLDGGVCFAHVAGDHNTLPSQPDVITKVLSALAGSCPGTLR